MTGTSAATKLNRTAFRTSRLLDFCSQKELIAQVGHQPAEWPLLVLKELVDNALDACEEVGVAPAIAVRVDDNGITVSDSGPGLPAKVFEGVLDFSVRVSSREAYVAPDRGAQGNALKTLVSLPFVLDGKAGRVEADARGVRHEITFAVDPIRQQPVIRHQQNEGLVKIGTRVAVRWPNSASSILHDAEDRFLQIADDYTWLNPHVNLEVDWFGERRRVEGTNPSWPKWRPSDPTSAHWYQPKHMERLIAGYVADDENQGRERTVATLAESGATQAEIAFLLNHRAELNAFASDELVRWIEGKLEEHGVRKVIPGETVLEEAYLRQRQSVYLKQHFGELLERSRQHIASLDVFPDLQGQVARLLEEQPEFSWDDAIAQIVRNTPAKT